MRILLSALLLAMSPAFCVEEIKVNLVPVGGAFKTGHMEGGALGKDGVFYYTNNPKKTRGIYAVDLKSPKKGTWLAYAQPAGGTWIKNGQITFCSGTSVLQIELGADTTDPGVRDLVADLPFAANVVKPNDVVADGHGGFYFTDWKGKAVYYINGTKSKLVARYEDDGDKTNDHPDELSNPNGIMLSPDEKTLYVTDSTNILHAPLAAPGRLASPFRQLLPGAGVLSKAYAKRFHFSKVTKKKKGKEISTWSGEFGSNLNIDGMTRDSRGIIYGAGLGSGVVYGWDGKTGELLRAIQCPGGAVNCVVGRIGSDEVMIIVGRFGIARTLLP